MRNRPGKIGSGNLTLSAKLDIQLLLQLLAIADKRAEARRRLSIVMNRETVHLPGKPNFAHAPRIRSIVRVIAAMLFAALAGRAQDPAVAPEPFPAAADDQTGYFLHVVKITNPSGSAYPGIRVLVRDLPADTETNIVRVANAHGLTNNIPFFDFGAIAAGGAVDLTVAYYIRNRRTTPAPRYEATVHGGIPQLVLPTTLLVTNNATRYVEGKFFAEFKTQEGRAYFVQYNSSVTNQSGWKTALPAIRGTGSNVQWMDLGPPVTDSKPAAEGSRFYRVLALPQ